MAYLPFTPDGNDEPRDALLHGGRRLLWVALVAALILLPAISSRSGMVMAVGVAAWVACTWGGMAGVSKVARALGTPAPLKYAALAMAMMPLLNLLPIGAFLLLAIGEEDPAQQARLQQDAIADARTRARERSRRPTQPAMPESAPATLPPPASPDIRAAQFERLARALPKVKHAALHQLEDGQLLPLQISDPRMAEAPDAQHLPLMRATRGVFGVTYAVDEGAHYALATPHELQQAGMFADELHCKAVTNLAAAIGSGALDLRLLGNRSTPYMGIAMGGDFEASTVLLDRLWDEKLTRYTPNGAVVAIPARDVCAFCDAESAEGIAHLQQLVARMRDEGRMEIEGGLLQRQRGRWVPYPA